MATKIQLRRGTTSEWTIANPVLSSGEVGVDTTLNKFKIGDGGTAWVSLDYFGDVFYQPVDSDLTAISGLATTTFGRSLLTTADAAAARIALGVNTGAGDMLTTNNLSDLTNVGTARTNLGLGTAATANSTAFDIAGAAATVQAASQPVDSDLTAIAALATTAFGRSLLTQADAATARATLGVGAGTGDMLRSNNLSDVLSVSTARTNLGLGTAATQASTAFDFNGAAAAVQAACQPNDTDLTAIAALTSAADKLPYATGAATWALTTFTAAGRALVDDADATAQRATLGLGTAATTATTAYEPAGSLLAALGLGVNTDITAITDTSTFITQDGQIPAINARTYFLDDTTIAALPSYLSLNGQVAINTAAISALGTQSQTIGVHGLASSTSNSTAVQSDIYNQDTGTTLVINDKVLHTASYLFTNSLPVTDKTTVVISTTSASSTITATSGTFASTDTDRLIVATNIPANTFLVFVNSTSATLKDTAGAAVTAIGSGTGITTVISSPNVSIAILMKVNGNNYFNPSSLLLAPTGSSTLIYAMNFWMEISQGTDNLHRTIETHLRVFNTGTLGGTSAPAAGFYTEPSPSNRPLELTLISSHTATDWGTTRYGTELRVSMTRASASYTFQRVSSSLILARA